MTLERKTSFMRVAAGAIVAASAFAWFLTNGPAAPRGEGGGSAPPRDTSAGRVSPALPLRPMSQLDAARSSVASARDTPGDGAIGSNGPACSALSIRVVDRGDTPIVGAQLFVSEGDEGRELGSTDASGAVDIAPAALERAWRDSYAQLICRRQGFALCTRFVAVDERRVVLHLRPAARIGGHIVDRDGTAVSGVRVVAWEFALGPAGPELFTRALAGHPGVHTVESDAAGRFEFDDLDVEHTYSITAGGKGLLAARPSYGVEPGTDDLRLVVVRAFGVRLRVIDDSGRQPALPRGLSAASVLQFASMRAEPRIGSAEYGSELLLGLGADARDLESLDFALVMTSSGDDASLGPFALSVAVPGYETRTVPYELGRLPDELRLYTIELRRRDSCTGSVVVSATGVANGRDATDHSDPLRGACKAQLVLAARERPPLLFDLSLNGSTACTLDDVPCDRYEASVRWPQGTDAHLANGLRSSSIEVGSSPARVEIDAARLGRVRLTVGASARADGETFDGPLVVKLIEVDPLRPGEPGRAGTFSFQHAPYELACVPEGDYSFFVSEPPAFSESGDCFSSVHVGAGQTTTAAFRLVANSGAR